MFMLCSTRKLELHEHYCGSNVTCTHGMDMFKDTVRNAYMWMYTYCVVSLIFGNGIAIVCIFATNGLLIVVQQPAKSIDSMCFSVRSYVYGFFVRSHCWLFYYYYYSIFFVSSSLFIRWCASCVCVCVFCIWRCARVRVLSDFWWVSFWHSQTAWRLYKRHHNKFPIEVKSVKSVFKMIKIRISSLVIRCMVWFGLVRSGPVATNKIFI